MPILTECSAQISPAVLDSVICAPRAQCLYDLKHKYGFKVALYSDNFGPGFELIVRALELRMCSRFDWVQCGNALPGQARQKNLFDMEEVHCGGEPQTLFMYDDRPSHMITHDPFRHILRRVSRYKQDTDPIAFAERAGVTLSSDLHQRCVHYYAYEQARWMREP